MSLRIHLARFIKRSIWRWRLDALVRPFPIEQIACMARMARWIRAHPAPFTDRDTELGDTGVAKPKRYDLYRHVIETEGLAEVPIEYYEFGVATGESILWWLEHQTHPDSRFAGYDTFTGLPEGFGAYGVGAFSTDGQTPETDDPRCRFVAGLFDETLGDDLVAHPPAGHRIVLHADADLYTSTVFCLTRMAPYLKSGDILLFDEFSVPTHEFRAFEDVTRSYRMTCTLLGAVNNHLQVAFRID